MFRILSKFLALPRWRKRLTSEAIFFLYYAKFLLLVVPVKRVISLKVCRRKTKRDNGQADLTAIRQALGDADRLSFWKNRCLVRSLAGRWMLQRRGLGSQISFGVKHDDAGRLTAHAWLKSGDFEVVGKDGDYVELARY